MQNFRPWLKTAQLDLRSPWHAFHGCKALSRPMLRSFRSRRLLESGAHALYNTVFCPVMLPFVVHSRVASPVPYNGLTQLAPCKSLSTTTFDRYSTVHIAQKHKQICSASASTASNTQPLETAKDSAIQPHVSHGLSPEQAAAVFAGDGHLR